MQLHSAGMCCTPATDSQTGAFFASLGAVVSDGKLQDQEPTHHEPTQWGREPTWNWTRPQSAGRVKTVCLTSAGRGAPQRSYTGRVTEKGVRARKPSTAPAALVHRCAQALQIPVHQSLVARGNRRPRHCSGEAECAEFGGMQQRQPPHCKPFGTRATFGAAVGGDGFNGPANLATAPNASPAVSHGSVGSARTCRGPTTRPPSQRTPKSQISASVRHDHRR